MKLVKKVLLILVLTLVLGGLGFAGYKYYLSHQATSTQNTPEAGSTQLCDLKKNTCNSFEATSDSGTLRITLVNGSDPAPDLEVDLGSRPGAEQYYMKMTDAGGVALFEGIPAGSYVIYFNLNAFPSAYGTPQTQSVTVVKGQTETLEIQLGQ
jgi:hypothetical protein